MTDGYDADRLAPIVRVHFLLSVVWIKEFLWDAPTSIVTLVWSVDPPDIEKQSFSSSKMARNISLITQYLVFVKSPRDQQQIMVLARQLYPDSHLFHTYEKATKRGKCYGYLFIDLKPHTPDDQRLKTNILQQESTFPNPEFIKGSFG